MRRQNDYYRTMESLIDPIKPIVKQFDYFIDPCVGDNIILNSLGVSEHHTLVNDIDPKWAAHTHEDARHPEFWREAVKRQIGRHTLCVTNPPFKHAFKILENAWDHCNAVAFLLRLSFLEPTFERSKFLHECPPKQIIVNPRTSFTDDGKTDSVTTAWMIWGEVFVKNPIVIAEKVKRKCRKNVKSVQ